MDQATERGPRPLYQDIAERTQGDLYLGVVGPVRTGKSTFIAGLMERMVLPMMAAGPRRERLMDELPQSGSGKTIMTTQPKFIPGEGAAEPAAANAGDQSEKKREEAEVQRSGSGKRPDSGGPHPASGQHVPLSVEPGGE